MSANPEKLYIIEDSPARIDRGVFFDLYIWQMSNHG